MKILIDGRNVDVLDRKCAKRDCFVLGFNKGPFVPGRGYTDPSRKPIACCQTRHLQGCPTNSVCPACRLTTVEPANTFCQSPMCGHLTDSLDTEQTNPQD